MSEQPPRIYSLSKDVAEELTTECKLQIGFLESSLEYYLEQESINRQIISLLCDGYAATHHILKELAFYVENNLVNFDDGEEQVAIPAESMQLFESAILTRHFTLSELCTRHISLAVN